MFWFRQNIKRGLRYTLIVRINLILAMHQIDSDNNCRTTLSTISMHWKLYKHLYNEFVRLPLTKNLSITKKVASAFNEFTIKQRNFYGRRTYIVVSPDRLISLWALRNWSKKLFFWRCSNTLPANVFPLAHK